MSEMKRGMPIGGSVVVVGLQPGLWRRRSFRCCDSNWLNRVVCGVSASFLRKSRYVSVIYESSEWSSRYLKNTNTILNHIVTGDSAGLQQQFP